MNDLRTFSFKGNFFGSLVWQVWLVRCSCFGFETWHIGFIARASLTGFPQDTEITFALMGYEVRLIFRWALGDVGHPLFFLLGILFYFILFFLLRLFDHALLGFVCFLLFWFFLLFLRSVALFVITFLFQLFLLFFLFLLFLFLLLILFVQRLFLASSFFLFFDLFQSWLFPLLVNDFLSFIFFNLSFLRRCLNFIFTLLE